jgi:hypothetical protein
VGLPDNLDPWYQTTGSDLPDARPDWRPDQQESGWYTRSVQVISGEYQGNAEINRGILGEYCECWQINTKSTIIYTSKNIRFHKNTILFIYIQILRFYSFCLFFEYCQKSHICKKHTFIKIAYFLKIIIIFIYPFFNILGKWGFWDIWVFCIYAKMAKIVDHHFWGFAGSVKIGGPEKRPYFRTT